MHDSSAISRFVDGRPLTFEGGFSHPAPIGHCDFHNHPFFELVYHAEGEGVAGLETGERVAFVKRSVVLQPPAIRHEQDTPDGGMDICILIGAHNAPPDALNRLLYVPRIRRPWILADIKMLSEAAGRESVRSDAGNHRATALFLEIVAEAFSVSAGGRTPAHEIADAAEEYIQREYAHVRSLCQISESLCISTDYLRHIYKNRFGIGLKRRMAQIRIQRACDLLTGSSLPIKAIAAMCGFENDRYFSTCFKREMDCVAGEYRRRWAGRV